ncbi:MAG: OmpW family outer membrane protein [Gemmatimonadales bacterium]|jgi:outer membrane protein W
MRNRGGQGRNKVFGTDAQLQAQCRWPSDRNGILHAAHSLKESNMPMRRSSGTIIALTLAGLSVTITPGTASAQDPTPVALPWTFRTNAIVTGNSDRSDPEGYKVYSSIGLQVGLDRALSRPLQLAITLATESREVDVAEETGPDTRLGSLELLPVNLLLQLRPRRGGRLHPYVGGGLNATFCWEKSGQLDSLDVAPSFGPALQLGLDLDLSSYILLNLDLRWNTLRPEITSAGAETVTLKIDPLTFGIGVGFRF